MWPRPNPGNVSSSNFNPAQFWVHGGPLFFGEKLSAEVASGHDVSSVLPCHCEVEMDTADNVEVHQTILYHLNLSESPPNQYDTTITFTNGSVHSYSTVDAASRSYGNR